MGIIGIIIIIIVLAIVFCCVFKYCSKQSKGETNQHGSAIPCDKSKYYIGDLQISVAEYKQLLIQLINKEIKYLSLHIFNKQCNHITLVSIDANKDRLSYDPPSSNESIATYKKLNMYIDEFGNAIVECGEVFTKLGGANRAFKLIVSNDKITITAYQHKTNDGSEISGDGNYKEYKEFTYEFTDATNDLTIKYR